MRENQVSSSGILKILKFLPAGLLENLKVTDTDVRHVVIILVCLDCGFILPLKAAFFHLITWDMSPFGFRIGKG